MAKSQLKFEERLKLLNRKQKAGSRGYVMRMQPNGVSVARPKRQPFGLPFRVGIYTIAALIGFKAFVFAGSGQVSYDAHLAHLQSGTAVEKAGAYVMQADPLTLYVAAQIGPILR